TKSVNALAAFHAQVGTPSNTSNPTNPTTPASGLNGSNGANPPNPSQTAPTPPSPVVPPPSGSPSRSGQLSRSEREGLMLSQRVMSYLKSEKAIFFQGEEDDTPRVLIGSQVIPLNFSDSNDALCTVFLKATQHTSGTTAAKLAIKRLRSHATAQSGSLRL